MMYFVMVKEQVLFFAYFNTYVGELFWLSFILKKDYPMKPIALGAFVTKFIADTLVIPVYYGKSIPLIDFMCITLPIIELSFVFIYLIKNLKHTTD